MKKAVKIIIFILVILLLAGGVFLYKYLRRVKFNTSYVNGNTAGNLYNAGLFCESNGVVFFSNPDDDGKLYSMDPNGTNVKKLCEDTAMYINADDNYVYYVRNNQSPRTEYSFFSYNNYSLCRVPRKGGKETILDVAPCIYATLIGNYIYYLHYEDETATTLYKIRIDGKEKEQVLDHYIFTCSSLGQYFYYNDYKVDGNIYQYDTATDTSILIYQCDSYKPIVSSDSNIFYLDVSQNNALVHSNTSFDIPVTLTKESIDCYNVYGSYIYYQTYDPEGSKLCMIRNDGTEQTTIALGTYCYINVTSTYIYFMDFQTHKMYYTPTAMPGAIMDFHPGVDE